MKAILVALACTFSLALSLPRQEDESEVLVDDDPVSANGVPYYPKGPVTINGMLRVKGGCGLHSHKGGCKGYGGIKGRLMVLRMHGVMIPLGYGHGLGLGLGRGLGLGVGLGKGIGFGIGGLGLGKGFGIRGGYLGHKGKK